MQRWRPWNATSGPDEAFYSNNPTLGYDRWQVMNPVFVELPAYAALDYGKFINSTYSYQVIFCLYNRNIILLVPKKFTC
jgi:hypothetical protein